MDTIHYNGFFFQTWIISMDTIHKIPPLSMDISWIVSMILSNNMDTILGKLVGGKSVENIHYLTIDRNEDNIDNIYG